MTKKKLQDEKRPAVTPVKGRLLVFLACLEETGDAGELGNIWCTSISGFSSYIS